MNDKEINERFAKNFEIKLLADTFVEKPVLETKTETDDAPGIEFKPQSEAAPKVEPVEKGEKKDFTPKYDVKSRTGKDDKVLLQKALDDAMRSFRSVSRFNDRNNQVLDLNPIYNALAESSRVLTTV
jgi:hypothetical protein